MKQLYLILILFFVSAGLSAQQVGMLSHYFYKPMVYNPAFTGNSDATQAMMISRSQWVGFKDAPQLNMFTLDGSIKDKKVGLGLTLINDKRGINKRTGGYLSYAYRLNFNEDAYLSLGLSAGIISQTIDYSKVFSEDSNDPTLFLSMQQKTTFDGNAGLALIWKGLEFGAAVPQLFANKVNYVDNTNVRAYYTQVRHYMTSLKYKFPLSKEKGISVAPQALVRFVPNTPMQYDGNINFDWQDKFWLGATYKSNYAVAINVGICIHKQLSVGYSYDYITGSIGKYSGLSHEIMVNFKFGKNKKQELPDTINKTEEQPKIAENTVYEKRMDSIQNQLAESDQKLKSLNSKLEEQSKAIEQLKTQAQQNNNSTNNSNNNSSNTSSESEQNNSNQSNTVLDQNKNKVLENNVWIATNQAAEYKDANNRNPAKGFYIIVGIFYYRDFAIAETQRFVARGFKESSWIYSDTQKFNYIYTKKVATKEEALLKVKDAQKAGVSNAWIQVLE